MNDDARPWKVRIPSGKLYESIIVVELARDQYEQRIKDAPTSNNVKYWREQVDTCDMLIAAFREAQV